MIPVNHIRRVATNHPGGIRMRVPKVRRIFSLACRFGLGFFIGLTTLVGTAVAMALFTVMSRIDYGPLLAVVLGC